MKRARAKQRDAASLARLHESLLFVRAYPPNMEAACLADEHLLRFQGLVDQLRAAGADLEPLEEPEVSGIAGTGLSAVFSYGVARHLARCHSDAVEIAWDSCDSLDPFARLMPHLAPLSDEDAQVEAHVPWDEWIRAAAGSGSALAWLLRSIERRFPDQREAAERYENLQLPLRWNFGGSTATRTLMRLPVKKLFCHDGPMLTRRDVSLDAIPSLPPLPVSKVSREAGEMLLALARDTSAVRYRELHGFTWGDPRYVYKIDAGRGVLFFLNGVPPARRLPLRAYHSLTIWKNGVPAGYFEGLSLCERMEAGFNLYYTFREGETAWLYSQLLRALRQALGVTCFVLDPYQIGHENDEAIDSGAFWFYRKLGFRSTCPELRELTKRAERRIAASPGYRTPASTLRKLVREPMIYEFPGTGRGEWDRFHLRRLGLSLAPNGGQLKLPPELALAKRAPEESRYLRLMQKDARFRRRILQLGSEPSC